MANQTVTVLEADGLTQTDVEVLGFGRQAAAASKSTAMSTEDKAVLDSIDSDTSRLTSSATNIAAGSALATTSFVVGSRYNSTPPTFTNGQEGALQISAAGRLLTDTSLAAETTKNIGTVRIGDGTDTAAVMPASTAPVATDTALVVSISPNTQNANGQATMANSAPVAIASDDPVAVSLALIDDAIKADDAAFTPATTKVMMAGFQADEASIDSVDEGDAGAARMTLDRKIIVTTQPHTAGGLSVFFSLDLDETEEDVKTSAGCLYKIRATNRTTSVRYLKLYNDTAANVVVGTTTTPTLLDIIPIPANASDYTVLTESFGGVGLTFSTALSMAVTTGFAIADTGAPGANDVIVSAYYK